MAAKKVAAVAEDAGEWQKKFVNKVRQKEKELDRADAEVEQIAGELKSKKKERKIVNEELRSMIRGGPDRTSELNFDDVVWGEQPLRNLGVDAKTREAINLLLDDRPLVTCGQLSDVLLDTDSFDASEWFTEKQLAAIDKAMDDLKKKFPGTAAE